MSGEPEELAKAILDTPTPAVGLTRGVLPLGKMNGVVQAIDTTETPWTVSVTLAGSSVQIDNVAYLVSGYTPTVGDKVTVLASGTDYLVIGSEGPGAGPGGAAAQIGAAPAADSADDIVFRPDGVNNAALTLQNAADATEGLGIAGQAANVVVSTVNGGQLTLMAPQIAINGINEVDISSTGDVNLDAGPSTLSLTGTQVVFTSLDTAPILSELNPTDFALWLDPTPGATTVNVTAKDSNGLEVDMVLESAEAAPGGQIGYATASATQLITGTAFTTVTGLSITVVLTTPRNLKATLFLPYQAGTITSTETASVAILQDGTRFGAQPTYTVAAQAFGSFCVSVPAMAVPAGSHTFTVQAIFTQANATNKVNPGTKSQAYLLLEDTGGA